MGVAEEKTLREPKVLAAGGPAGRASWSASRSVALSFRLSLSAPRPGGSAGGCGTAVDSGECATRQEWHFSGVGARVVVGERVGSRRRTAE